MKLAPRSAREPQGRHVGSGTLYTSLSPVGTYRCSPITGREEIRAGGFDSLERCFRHGAYVIIG